MRYASAGAFRMALEQRLLSQTHSASVPLVRFRKLVVFDRLLARLVVAAPNRWVLKGAVALYYRVGPSYRTTKDLDLGRHDDEQAATNDFRLARSVDLDDYFEFTIQRTSKLDVLLDGVAVRYRVSASVDARQFEDVTIDVGFGGADVEVPELLQGPGFLSFGGIPAVEVPTLPLNQHLAEKVHAYTRMYASGRASSRVKDLVDLVIISQRFPFKAAFLMTALQATFGIRAVQALPAALPSPPPEWKTSYATMATEVKLNPVLTNGYEQARKFLNPVLAGTLSDEARWDPIRQTW